MKNERISAFVIPSVVEESLTTLPDMIRDVSTSLDMTEKSRAQDESLKRPWKRRPNKSKPKPA
jgi:hypothetical protein